MAAKPSAKDEVAFMEDLLSGLDSSFFENTLSPDPTPKKRKREVHEMPEPVHTPVEAKRSGEITSEPLKKRPRMPEVPGDAEIAALLEGAEDWDWDDMLSPVRKKSQSVSPPQAVGQDLRCIAESVEHCGSTKKIHVVVEKTSQRKTIVAKDDWVETDVHAGDTLNVVGVFPPQDDTNVISAKSNLLILHPDTLITATSIANALHCPRRALLSLLVRSSCNKTRSLIWGSLLHEVMQRCLSSEQWDASNINAFIEEGIQKNMMDLVHIDVGIEEARTEIKKRAGGLKSFGDRFLSESPKRNAILSNTRDSQETVARLAIARLFDVEEEIWSPKYGLKGKIDASLQVRIDEYMQAGNAKHKPVVTQPRTTLSTMPLEIKTGYSIGGMEHRAQTMLYSVLMSERYGATHSGTSSNGPSSPGAAGGLLFYTQSEELIKVPTGRNELRGLVMVRNELASYLMRRSSQSKGRKEATDEEKKKNDIAPFLPPTIDQEHACRRCYVSDACMLYRKAVDDVEDNNTPISDLYEFKTGHLSQEQLKFFKHWENLISLEEQDMTKFRKELWSLNADDREKAGRCLANMILDTAFPSADYNAAVTHIHRYTYRFVRRGQPTTSRSLLNGNISSGDPVVISDSDDLRLLALARGFVLQLTPTGIVIGVDHSLSLDFIRSLSPTYGTTDEIVFRIDKDDLMGGMVRVRDNLAQLFYVSNSRRLLEYVVDLKPPTFNANVDVPSDCYSDGLNRSQLQALQQALGARDYALILGMPGTGKTTTVTQMIRTMVQMGKTVLLTSYTHSAVDTILLKLKDAADFDILRLGNKDKVHPGLQEFTIEAGEPPATIEQLERRLLSPPVVAATALSIDHALFSRRRFDYCIVDEASQITLPTCIGPLRFADKFILVGDHFQLPPLVKSKDARKGGLDVSLFRRLSDAHPHAVVDLTYQYRMNADIMLLSNKLVYSDRLKCGSPEVANQSLHIPRMIDCSCSLKDSPWIKKVMDESTKAIFVDTDAVPALDSRVGDLIQNETEAKLVQQLTLALLKGGVSKEQIAILSLYRQQIKLLSHLLQEHKGIEILTADRSQGRDKDCIIISLVRANKDNQIGDLLKDWRRVNVAFTRARAKLVIFGSRTTLKASPLLSDFFDLMEERGWVLTLPVGADMMHTKGKMNITGRREEAAKDASANTTRQKDLHRPKKTKEASVATGLIRSRPILRDILNDVK